MEMDASFGRTVNVEYVVDVGRSRGGCTESAKWNEMEQNGTKWSEMERNGITDHMHFVPFRSFCTSISFHFALSVVPF